MAPFASAAMAVATELIPANLFELSSGDDGIAYTVRNFVGKRQIDFNGRTFVGDEILSKETALGTLLTVELKAIPDHSRHFLTVVLPEVLVRKNGTERLNMPVLFHTVKSSIAGPPLHPCQVQVYDVKVFSGTATFVITSASIFRVR